MIEPRPVLALTVSAQTERATGSDLDFLSRLPNDQFRHVTGFMESPEVSDVGRTNEINHYRVSRGVVDPFVHPDLWRAGMEQLARDVQVPQLTAGVNERSARWGALLSEREALAQQALLQGDYACPSLMRVVDSLFARGELASAQEVQEWIVALYPEHADSHADLMEILLARGNFSGAEAVGMKRKNGHESPAKELTNRERLMLVQATTFLSFTEPRSRIKSPMGAAVANGLAPFDPLWEAMSEAHYAPTHAQQFALINPFLTRASEVRPDAMTPAEYRDHIRLLQACAMMGMNQQAFALWQKLLDAEIPPGCNSPSRELYNPCMSAIVDEPQWALVEASFFQGYEQTPHDEFLLPRPDAALSAAAERAAAIPRPVGDTR
ncbi:MAG: hypothetical protein H7255_13165 [Ramlibacter sp.]|nr:hypothetical protein [Ramlibacter sp.]